MTKVFFYYDAEDRLGAAITWLQQAHRKRQQVVVYAPDPLLATELDRLLWVRPATGFLPHCRGDSALATMTPVVISSELEQLPHEECLLNLSNEVPPGFSRFSLLIEIAGTAPEERLPARERFKFYRDRGYELQSEKFDPATLLEAA